MDTIAFTRDVEARLDGLAPSVELADMHRSCCTELERLVGVLRDRTLPRLQRDAQSPLVGAHVHRRDILERLVTLTSEGSGAGEADLEWALQLRYYWEGKDVVASCGCHRLNYGYEYLGACPRLVMTPLTNRVYLSTFGALQLHMGVALQVCAG